MFIRYAKASDRLVQVAKVYSKEEHGIDPLLVDEDAKKAVQRLNDNGHEAYIVGGAVRDLLLGRTPKDFDIATSASPRQVSKLFYNARAIGKRFKIVHLIYGDKILEVSTFRGPSEEGSSNIYGTIEEDAARRDFSINSLYYDPFKELVIDFNGSMKDFSRKTIRSILPLDTTFVEDPVRMIRALKYSATTGFSIRFDLGCAIKKNAREISKASTSRLTEEVNKILSSGCSQKIFTLLSKYGLLPFILPAFSVFCNSRLEMESLEELDRLENEARSRGESLDKSVMYEMLLSPLIARSEEELSSQEMFKDVFRQMKVLLSPITPANIDLEKASISFLLKQGIEYKQVKRKPAVKDGVARKKKKPFMYQKSKKKVKINPEAPAQE